MILHDIGLLFILGMFAIMYGLFVYLVWRITGNMLAKLKSAEVLK